MTSEEQGRMTPDEQGRMTPENFCYWLRGFAELSSEQPTPEQWASICEHLQLVFKKETAPATKFEGGDEARKVLEVPLKGGGVTPSLQDMARRANDCTHPPARYWAEQASYWAEQLRTGIIPISSAYRRPRKEGPAFDLTGQTTC